MFNPLDHPFLILAASRFWFWAAAWIGGFFVQFFFHKRKQVLGLIIGFTFSVAVSRYDQRRNYEEAEAKAIGTEYLRADFLGATDGSKVRALVKVYLDQRIIEYKTKNPQ